MNKIVTIAAIAALTTLSACNSEEVTVSEAVETEVMNDDVTYTEEVTTEDTISTQ
jgi:hypothetical protein